MPVTLSPCAELVGHPRDVVDRRSATPYGVCVHTTGGGVLARAKELGIRPVDVAVALYTTPGENFGHYVVAEDGSLFQIADERERAWHAAISPQDRALYVSGAWTKLVSQVVLPFWKRRWPGKQSPLGLFPSKSPNEDYIGVEMIPQPARLPNGSLFTRLQYVALGELLDDIEDRHAIRLAGSRLLGHEDLEPLQRWSKTMGWDPGSLAPHPAFFWDLIPGRARGLVG